MTSVEKVKETLSDIGIDTEIVTFDQSTRSSQEAADAIGCSVSQIAKSLLFRGKKTLTPIMVIASGSNMVDTKKIKVFMNENIGRADADFVKENTGYTIGGVPPVGHIKPIRIFIDEDLIQYDIIWAAAGSPHSVFKLTPDDLVKITNGDVVNTKKNI